MLLFRKPVIIVLAAIALLVVLFISLLRGCLARFDERAALAPALFFERDGRQVVFALVKFDKTTSYSQKGNFISKSVSTTYSVQANEAVTARKMAEKKIRKHSDIKNYPVEVLGASGGRAWVFAGELMAFDPFSLEEMANLRMLEQNNPSLKDRFPSERRFYRYDPADQSIHFVAADGSRWQLDTRTLLAIAETEEADATAKGSGIDLLQKRNREEMDSLIEQKLRRPSRQLAAGIISMNEYKRIGDEFRAEQAKLYHVRDSLQALASRTRASQRTADEEQRRLNAIRGKTGLSFSQSKVNMDTFCGRWYGLYTRQEIAKLPAYVQYQVANDETARRNLITSVYRTDENGITAFDKQATNVQTGQYFLNGGFLLDKNTGLPIRRGGKMFVVHKDQIGKDGVILLSLIDDNANNSLMVDARLKEWTDWIVTPTRILIFGKDKEDLSGNEINVFLSVDLDKGVTTRYDYFTDEQVVLH